MKIRLMTLFLVLLFLIGAVLTHSLMNHPPEKTQKEVKTEVSTSQSKVEKIDPLPGKKSDWSLVLVNREHPKPEFNPSLSSVNGIQVDQRIAEATRAFLEAAQKVAPEEHLISGYRSVAYQDQLYQKYIKEERDGLGTVNTSGQKITTEQAIKNVQTYAQPAGSSEHNTGLAVDLSDVDSLNESKNAKQVALIAPNYGFVLRFPEGKEAKTGVDYEDWHFRYVGVENAKYMTLHQLSLEEYTALLPE